MSGMTDIMMIGLVAIAGWYILQSGALNNLLQPTQAAPAPAPVYTTPAPATVPTLETQCTQESGVWQGNCCSCPNKTCTNKCGVGQVAHTNEEACETEDGVWQYNRYPQCCSCPNKECSYKCGSIKKTPSGGVPGTISESTKAAGLCKSEGSNNVWNAKAKCCTCANRCCKNKCGGPCKTATKAPAPAKKSSGGQNAKELDVKNNPALQKQNAKINQCRNLTGASYKACLASYAHAYMAGSSNRRGPSYTGRDDFKHLTHVEFPTPIDFQYEASAHPYYLGPRNPERASLLKRFNSNFANVRFSG